MEEAKRDIDALHDQTCAILLFEEPGGEIESLSLVEGVLRVDGDVVMLLPATGGDPVRVPPRLVGAIERMTDDQHESLADITSTYWLRAFFDGRLSEQPFDLSAILARCSGPPAVE